MPRIAMACHEVSRREQRMTISKWPRSSCATSSRSVDERKIRPPNPHLRLAATTAATPAPHPPPPPPPPPPPAAAAAPPPSTAAARATEAGRRSVTAASSRPAATAAHARVGRSVRDMAVGEDADNRDDDKQR